MHRSNVHHMLECQNFPPQSLEAALNTGHKFSKEFMGIYSLILTT